MSFDPVQYKTTTRQQWEDAGQPGPARLRMAPAAACVRFERESFGALHQMLVGIDAGERPTVWAEIASEIGQFQTAEGFVGPCELLVASGAK